MNGHDKMDERVSAKRLEKIDKGGENGRLLGTPTRRRDEKPGGRRDSKEGLNEAGAGHPEEPH